MGIVIIILLFYSHILRIEVGNIKGGFDDCYQMINYYVDSSEAEKKKYEKIIKEMKLIEYCENVSRRNDQSLPIVKLSPLIKFPKQKTAALKASKIHGISTL